MLIWEAGTGLTKPSITPLFWGDGQLSAACAGRAVSSNSAKAKSRILIELPRGLGLCMLLEVINALVPLTKLISGPGQPQFGLNFCGFGPTEVLWRRLATTT